MKKKEVNIKKHKYCGKDIEHFMDYSKRPKNNELFKLKITNYFIK